MAQSKGINLEALKSEIKERKEGKGFVNGPQNNTPRKGVFIGELMKSLNTGREGYATEKIKEVENKAVLIENKKFNRTEKPKFNPSDPNNFTQRKPTVDMGEGDREDQMFSNFANQNKGSLSEQLFNTQNPHSAPKNQGQGYGFINEEHLVGVINRYVTENYVPLIEDSVKMVMLETYAVSRIKEVLTENNFLKGLVVEVIRELQKNKKQ